MEQITVNLLATGETPVCHASQFDDGRTIRFNLKKGAEVYTLSGTETVKMRIRKPDKTERVVDIVNTSGSYVDYVSVPEDCDIEGVNVCELVIDDIGSKNFIMNVEEDAYGGGADIETLSASGSIATFETNMVDNLVDLKADIEPIQDLHGYDYPWSAGAGKNVVDTRNIDTTTAGIHVTSDADGVISMTGTRDASTGCKTFAVFSDFPTGDYVFSTNNSHVTCLLNYTQKTSKFTVNTGDVVRLALNLSSGDVVSDTNIKVQIEKGSIATAWTPYENICPIEGHAEVKIVHTGKNLTDITTLPYTIHWGTDAANLVQFLNTLPVGRYTISNKYKINEVPSSGKVLHGAFLIRALVNGTVVNVTPYALVTDSNPFVGKVYQESVSFEITDEVKGKINHVYRYCDQDNPHSGSGRGSYDCYDIQVETGSVATDYETYTETEVTVQFGQTIYKGVLDAKNSKIIATHQYISDLSSYNYAFIANNNCFRTTNLNIDYKRTAFNIIADSLCEAYEGDTLQRILNQQANNGTYAFGVVGLYNGSILFRNTNFTDATLFKQSLSNVALLLELVEPIEIPLSAISQFETLLGVNNVYSDTGDVELKYLKQV